MPAPYLLILDGAQGDLHPQITWRPTFDVTGMSEDKYRDVLNRLAAAGQEHPSGRFYHCAYGDPNNLQVVDFWDSMESFDRFGQTLVPILQEKGISATPHPEPVRNQIMPPH
jgi:hypothetical protein